MPEEPEDDLEAFESEMDGGTPEPPSLDPEGALAAAMGDLDAPDPAFDALIRALGDMSLICHRCGDICDQHHHRQKIRDRVMLRGRELAQDLVKGIELYIQQRQWGLLECKETVTRVYGLWNELADLFEGSEPGDRDAEGFMFVLDADLGSEGPDEENDDPEDPDDAELDD